MRKVQEMKIKTFIEAVFILFILVLICTLTAMALAEPDYNFEETTYKVKSGDCLWDIADEYCPDSMDKRDYINLIKERNNLSNSVIRPGQKLIVFQSQP